MIEKFEDRRRREKRRIGWIDFSSLFFLYRFEINKSMIKKFEGRRREEKGRIGWIFPLFFFIYKSRNLRIDREELVG